MAAAPWEYARAPKQCPGSIRRVPRRRKDVGTPTCHCALSLPALLETAPSTCDPRRRPEVPPLPLPACQIHELILALPPRLRENRWRLIFSTDRDGFSLSGLYRAFESVVGPTLLLMEVGPRVAGSLAEPHLSSPMSPTHRVAGKQVIGAYLSDPPSLEHGQHRFYGTRECFVFNFNGPDALPHNSSASFAKPAQVRGLQTRRWVQGCNEEFLLSHGSYLGVGGGADGAAIYIANSLQYGTASVNCPTFASESDVRPPASPVVAESPVSFSSPGSPSPPPAFVPASDRHDPLVEGPTQGLRHVEFTNYRLQFFSLNTKFATALNAIPAAFLVDHLPSAASVFSTSVRSTGATGGSGGGPPTPAGSLAEPDTPHSRRPEFDVNEYRTAGCSGSSVHHRCPFIATALHHTHHGASFGMT